MRSGSGRRKRGQHVEERKLGEKKTKKEGETEINEERRGESGERDM